MHRRSFIATLAASSVALAGCTTLSGDDSPTDSVTPYDGSIVGTPDTSPPKDHSPDETQTSTPAEEPSVFGELTSVIELETVPRTYAFGATRLRTDDGAAVTLGFDRTATAEHPARLTGQLRNGNDYANTFEVEWIPAVGRVHSRQPNGYDHEASLHLAPTENNDLAETVPELARTDDGLWYTVDIGPWMTERHRLEPGETIDLEYVLVGEAGTPGRPTGTYEFQGRDETVSVTVWDTNSPGPEEQSRFDGRSVPEFESGRTVSWYHEADRGTQAFVRPSTERLELDGRLEFEMVNNSREGLRCGGWNIYKLVDGAWFHIAPTIHYTVCLMLGPGGRETSVLRAFNGDAVPCDGGHAVTEFSLSHLGGGEYAAVANYGYPNGESAALFELVGDPVTLTPTSDIEVERNGRTLTVTSDRYGDDEYPPDATLTLTRVENADERLIAEQVMRTTGIVPGNQALRNGLSVFESDVEEVVVRTDDPAVGNVVGHEATARRFRFRGQAYEVHRNSDA